MWTICRKELADHFSSIRFLILFCLILMVALVSTYMAATNVREALEVPAVAGDQRMGSRVRSG
jgi:ABC-2 type transport system permease protein